MRHVYLAATGQNRGKTTVSLGVLDGFGRRGLSTGFLKPVGQRTVMEDGVPADEDAVLMKQVFALTEPLRQMSPVHIPRGFTQSYIEGAVVADLPARIRAAHAAFIPDRDMLLIEGTGHAGVGAVIGLSNAVVAAMLGAPAVIVSEGGVGRPIDEIVLNAALFERHGVKVAGAIVNKVDLDAKPGLARTLERGLAAMASRCWVSCRTGGSCPTRLWPWCWRVSRGRRSTAARIWTRSSVASRSARWSQSTCSSASARAAWSSFRATERT